MYTIRNNSILNSQLDKLSVARHAAVINVVIIGVLYTITYVFCWLASDKDPNIGHDLH